MTVQTLRMWPIDVPEKAPDKNRADNKVWIVPAPFCVLRYLIDTRFLHKDSMLSKERWTKPRQNDAMFVQCKPSFVTNKI